MLDLKEEKAIANIESELVRLWDEQKEKNQTKASLFNLIIYSDEPRRTAYFQKRIQSIIQKYPSRIIFIEAKKKCASNLLHVSVSTQTTGSEGSLIACDQILIESSFDQLHRISFIVLPHLVPDLPIYLLWGQDPTSKSEILPSFEKIATRLIFDSECTEDLQHFSQQMLTKMSSLRMEFMDMHWATISGWRKLLATLFDSPEKNHLLRSSKKIIITYNSRKTEFFHHYETQSIYLQAWLAGQMGWNLKSMEYTENTRKITYQTGSNTIEVNLVAKLHETHQSGAILGIDIHSVNDVLFSITRDKPWNRATCHVSYRDKCEMPHTFTLPDVERGFNFMREVFFSTPNNHYSNMLEVISKTNWETSK